MTTYLPDPNGKIEYVLVPLDGDVNKLQKVLTTMNIKSYLHNEKSLRAELSQGQKTKLEKWATLF